MVHLGLRIGCSDKFWSLDRFQWLFVIAWSASPSCPAISPMIIARKKGGSSLALAGIQVEFSFVTALVNGVMRVEGGERDRVERWACSAPPS